MALKDMTCSCFYFGGCGGLEGTIILQFLLWADVVVLKELIFNSFYVGKVWWSSQNCF